MQVLAFALAILVGVSSALLAQGPPFWVKLSDSGPPPQQSPVMVYDQARARLVLFGEAGTWERAGGAWIQVATSGPSARRFHAMAYDDVRGRTVLFGGLDNSGFRGDTWLWDGVAWSQQAVPGSPAARILHAMVHNGTWVVMYGGQADDGSCQRDTWLWNGTGWMPTHVGGPGPRMGHTLAYDSARQQTVLFGGWDCDQTQYGDVHEWSGSTSAGWYPRANTGPGQRDLHAMTFDAALGRTVLFGGHVNSTLAADTWTWDGTNWLQLAITGPAPRESATMAFDAAAGHTVLFGGYDGGNIIFFGDTWELGSTFGASAVQFGVGCGAPTLALVADPNARPVVGTVGGAIIGNIPASPCFVAAGWSRTRVGTTPLPMPLAAWGMPGCELLQSTDELAFVTTPTGGGTARFQLAVPGTTALLGLRVHLQAWAAAPGGNPANLIVSNGLEWFVGNS